ncbi:MAG: alanine racemase [Pseudomonadota bacterium]
MRAHLTIDLGAIAANWRALDAMTSAETGAVVKADAYGLGVDRVCPALAAAGAKTFFVALAEEGVAARAALGPGPRIFVFSGLMAQDAALCLEHDLLPLLNSPRQAEDAARAARGMGRLFPCGLQIDSGMNRLGFCESEDLDAFLASDIGKALDVQLVMSHLACADEPSSEWNERQRKAFNARRPAASASLAATGGVLLGPDYHFDLTRPGVGLYGGLPFEDASRVVSAEIPIIQRQQVKKGEIVGYGAAYVAERDMVTATIAAGYADGLIRAMGAGFKGFIKGREVRSVGRVSMDLITLDVTDIPEGAFGTGMVELLGPNQTVDKLASAAGTIGYEILTSLGARYERRYISA